MKKITLLILTLVFAQGGLFALTYPGLTSGDYRTKNVSSYYFWNNNATWEVFNGTDWDTTTDIPGITNGAIINNVYILNDVYLRTFITVNSTGKIWVTDNGSVILNLGLGTSINGGITNFGDIGIESGGNAKLKIWDGSYIQVKPGGSITDNSGGGITSTAATSLILESEAGTQNASLITSSVVTGTFNQYISSGIWHLISPPFDGVIASDFYTDDNVYIRPYLDPGGGWQPYITDPATAIEAKKGYLVWESVEYTFNKSGTFLTGSQALPITYDGDWATEDDWNLLGNPYPCGLNWTLVMSNNNFKVSGNAFYVFNSETGLYEFQNTGGEGTANIIIPPFQGFFVHSFVNDNINLSYTHKSHPATDLYKSANADSFTNLIKLEADFKGQKSYTFSYQQEGATNGKDLEFDAPMLFSGSSSLMEVYTLADDQQTCINIYGEYPYVMNVDFKVPAEGGDITLTATDFRYLDANLVVSLQDTETGAYFDFLETPTYTFSTLGGDVTDRIYLIMNNNVGIRDIDKNSIQIFSSKNAVYLGYSDLQFSGELKIYNLLGQTVYQSKLTNTSYKPIYLNQPSAYYIVELITDNESITQKVFIQQ